MARHLLLFRCHPFLRDFWLSAISTICPCTLQRSPSASRWYIRAPASPQDTASLLAGIDDPFDMAWRRRGLHRPLVGVLRIRTGLLGPHSYERTRCRMELVCRDVLLSLPSVLRGPRGMVGRTAGQFGEVVAKRGNCARHLCLRWGRWTNLRPRSHNPLLGREHTRRHKRLVRRQLTTVLGLHAV